MLGIAASNYPRRSLSFVQRLHLDKIKQVLDRILHHHKTYMDEFFLLFFFQKKKMLYMIIEIDEFDAEYPGIRWGPEINSDDHPSLYFFLMISQREKNTFIIQQLMS